MCDGPVKYIGETANTLEILPPMKRSVATFSKVEIPYAFKLLDQEMAAYLNMGMRVLTEKDVKHFRGPPLGELTADEEERLLSTALPERILLETEVPEMIVPPEEPEVHPEDLTALGLTKEEEEEKEKESEKGKALVGVELPAAPNTMTIQLPAGMTATASRPNAVNSSDAPLEEDVTDDIPFSEESAPMQGGGQPQQQQQQPPVSVQTSSQPVLVIPMNVGMSAPTELVRPPMPGAPHTFAVDTSDSAMRGMNLPPVGQTARSRSNSNASSSQKRAPGSAAPNPVVNVRREGAGSPAPSSNANVRVTVMKQG
jgi:hypothetical protein